MMSNSSFCFRHVPLSFGQYKFAGTPICLNYILLHLGEVHTKNLCTRNTLCRKYGRVQIAPLRKQSERAKSVAAKEALQLPQAVALALNVMRDVPCGRNGLPPMSSCLIMQSPSAPIRSIEYPAQTLPFCISYSYQNVIKSTAWELNNVLQVCSDAEIDLS